MASLKHDINSFISLQQPHRSAEEAAVWAILANVNDPEIPVLSIVDLGIVRAVNLTPGSGNAAAAVEIIITPTYSGCPAMDVIAATIRMELAAHGYANASIKQVLSPAWTTDWMSMKGREKLMAYGIAPPNPRQQVCHQELFVHEEAVQCPHCHSYHTHRISEFGATACKSLHQCDDCHEPFDYFKCH